MAYTEDQYLQVVEGLYAAIGDSGKWPGALLAVGGWAGGADVCRLTGWDQDIDRPSMVVRASETVDDHALEDHEASYFEHYRSKDPRVGISEKHFSTSIGSCSDHISAGDAASSEFFQDFMRKKCDVRWTVGGRVFSEGSIYIDLALERIRSRSDFGNEDVKRLRLLEPHLRRALAAHVRLSSREMQNALVSDALDAENHGILVVDAFTRVRFANARAEALLRHGTYVVNQCGRLLAAVGAQLGEAILHVASTGQPASLKLLPRIAGEPACSALLTRRSGGIPDPQFRNGDGVKLVLCVLTIQGRERQVSARQLMDLFGFTAAQSRVARCLMADRSAEETSAELGVRISTVRTHISVVLQKTGTKNVAALCGLLARLPSARDSLSSTGRVNR